MNRNTTENRAGIATDEERRRLFLQYSNRGWLIFGLVAFFILPIFPEQRSQFIYLLIITLPTYLLIELLNRSGKTRLAAMAFTTIVNFGFYGLFMIFAHDLGWEEAFRSEATVWMLMGLAVLFAGALIDKRAAPLVALVNTALLFLTRLTIAPGAVSRPSVLVFWWMMAIIIWLYESVLHQAFSQIWSELAERKETEAALRESEKRYRLLAQNVTDVIWTMDMSLHSTYTSPSVKRLRGYDSEDAVVQPLEEALTPESFKIAARALKEELAKEEMPDKDPFRSRTLELEVIRKDGSTVWVETTMTFLRDLDGVPTEILGVNREITERKKSEQAIRESQARLTGILNSAMDAIISLDADQRIILFNPAAEQMFRCSASDVMGQPLDQLIPERFRENHQKHIYTFGHTNQSKRTMATLESLTCLRADREEFPAEITISQTTMAGEKIYTAILRDITDRVRAEEALRESEERLQLFIEHAPAALAMFDRDMRYLAVSQRWITDYHLGGRDIIGQDHYEILPDIPDRWKLAHRRGLAGEVVQAEQDDYVQPDGTVKWLRWEVRPWYTANGGIGGIVIFTEDISEGVQARETLNRRVDELTALYQTTLDIISAHDLPNLLNTIVARAVDLLDGTSGGLYLCDPDLEQVRCVVSYRTPEDYTGTKLSYGEGAAGVVAASGKPLIIDDYRSWDKRAKTYEDRHPFSAVISAPMLWQDQVTGVIHVLHDSEKHKFTEENLKLLTSFANHAAIAVENARLLEVTQRRLKRLSTLRQIDQVISSSLDLRVTLNILLGHILQQLEVDATTVLLYQPELQRLEFVAGHGFRTRAFQATSLRLGQGFAGKAALEQRIIQVSDLGQMRTGFLRSPEFHNEGFVTYVGVPLIAKGKITGVLEIYHRSPLNPDPEWMSFLETLAVQVAIAIDNIRLFEDLQSSNLQLLQAYDATIEGWAKALELRDMETEGHSQRVVEMTLELARKLDIEENHLTHIRWGALLHDIGKMGILDAILQKPAPLTDVEWSFMQQHPVYAHTWLSSIAYLKPALDIPYCHHEKWDGTGYPRGLKGEQIPLAARIFAIVDVWDALTSDRPYRKAWTKKKAFKYIQEQSGHHFDPRVVSAFTELFLSDENELSSLEAPEE